MITTREQAVSYLDSLIGSGIRPGLDRMRRLLSAAGNPERSVPAVLIAGTNGKGSTAATLSAIVHAAGYRTGLYTSPHLVDLEERWRIGEVPVSSRVFVAAVQRLEQCAVAVDFLPTYFEALTLLAFFIFEESECDLAILEVGMGGRLDATNVAEPILSVITPIDYDHQEWLGSTIEEIAGEKLGIARPSVPLLVAEQPEAVEILMRQRAGELGCPLHFVRHEVRAESFETTLRGSSVILHTPSARYSVESPLAGSHQLGNLATAVRAAEVLSRTFRKIDVGAITTGAKHTIWRGRLESFDVGGRLVVVDGAHNPAGTRSAAAFVKTLTKPRVLVFGALGDKDVRSMLDSLKDLFDHIILTVPDSERSIAPVTLSQYVAGRSVEVIPGAEDAIRSALAHPGISSVVVCGSLYLAGSAIRLLDTIASPSA